MNESLFGFRNPTENTLKCFQVLHDVLAKKNVRLELEICTLQNELIEYHCSLDLSELLSHWQSIGDLGIAFFRPAPIGSLLNCTIPIYSFGDVAVTCLGVIDNLSEIQEQLISYGYQFNSKNNVFEV